MGRPKKGSVRQKPVTGGRLAYYARFTDQFGTRHELLLGHSPDWTRTRAEEEVRFIVAQVERGVWELPRKQRPTEANPIFLDFASDWLARRGKEGLSSKTMEWYKWGLTCHLLPYLGEYRLSEIDARVVDSLRDHLLSKEWDPSRDGRSGRRLAPRTVNDCISILASILDVAVDYPDVPLSANPATGKRRRAKVAKGDPIGRWLEYDAVKALLDAGYDMDNGAGSAQHPLGRDAVLGLMFLGGLRVSETGFLRRQHVIWERAVLRLPDSKTQAGHRDIPMLRMLFDLMSSWWIRHPDPRPSALLVPTLRGTPRNRSNVRANILRPVREHADRLLSEQGFDPLPTGLTNHDGRRTALTWWAEAGHDPRTIMDWAGHEDPGLTLRIYQKARHRPKDPRIVAAMTEVPENERKRPSR